ncbi:DNA primase family protein [Dietzia sp. Alg238-R159]|uniref:DNA primase family protein n=1 Tax=Dietzia sp. Alg238-R159 TaxID=2305986 RepID=UPI0013D5FB49|nr:DNA primase family protein [Dietzia sp. Alg238-R159]
MSSSVYHSPSAPASVAKQLVREHFSSDGTMTLRWWQGEFYHWTGTRWKELDRGGLRSQLYEILDPVVYTDAGGTHQPWSPNRHKVGNLIEALQAVCYLDTDTEPHSWIDGSNHPPSGEFVSCENGLVHITNRELNSHTPALFNFVTVPFDYDPEATCPVWDSFMSSIWPEDEEAVRALQEWMGYVLSGRTDLQKIFMLVGPPRAGKGVIGRILTALVGRKNVCGPSLASLATDFGLAPLVGSSLALVSDARMRKDSQVLVERLLTISGEDTVAANRKYKEPWIGKLPARLMLMTNELPRLGDASQALAKRFLIVSMTRSFVGNEDTGMEGRLRAELAGIFNWALDGLDRLDERGAFVPPLSSLEDQEVMDDLSSPVAAFLTEELVEVPGERVSTDAVFDRWRMWRDRNGHSPTSKSGMTKDICAARPHLKSVSQYDPDMGRTRRFFNGVRLASRVRAAAGEV